MTEQQKGLKPDFFDGSVGEYRNQLHNEPEANPWIEWAQRAWIKGNNDSVREAYQYLTSKSQQAVIDSLLKTLKSAADDPNQSLKVPFIGMTLELIQATEDRSFLTDRGKDLPKWLITIYPRLAPADRVTFMAVLDKIKGDGTTTSPAPAPAPVSPTP